MKWKLKFTGQSLKQMKKLDPYTRTLLFNWMVSHLDGCEDPRMIGKALKGSLSGLWRYRMGEYRIICLLEDGMCTVLALNVGHRRDIPVIRDF